MRLMSLQAPHSLKNRITFNTPHTAPRIIKITLRSSILKENYKVAINKAITTIQSIMATMLPIAARVYAAVPRRGLFEFFATLLMASQMALKNKKPPKFIDFDLIHKDTK